MDFRRKLSGKALFLAGICQEFGDRIRLPVLTGFYRFGVEPNKSGRVILSLDRAYVMIEVSSQKLFITLKGSFVIHFSVFKGELLIDVEDKLIRKKYVSSLDIEIVSNTAWIHRFINR